jgi:hypothetical protein
MVYNHPQSSTFNSSPASGFSTDRCPVVQHVGHGAIEMDGCAISSRDMGLPIGGLMGWSTVTIFLISLPFRGL